MNHTLGAPLLSKSSQGIQNLPEVKLSRGQTDFEGIKQSLERKNTEVRTYETDGNVYKCQISSDGKQLTYITPVGVKVLDLSTFSEEYSYNGPFVRPEDSSDEEQITSESDSEIQEDEITIGHTSQITCFAISNNGKLFATGSYDTTSRLWDIQEKRQVKVFAGHTAAITCLAFGADDKFLATGGNDNKARLWDLEEGTLLNVFEGHLASICTLDFTPDGNFLVTCGYDSKAVFWDLQLAAQARVIRTYDSVSAFVIGYDGKYMATNSIYNTVRIFDIFTGSLEKEFKGHTGKITSLAFSEDDKYLCSASTDCTVRIWDISNESIEKILVGHSKIVSWLGFTQSGKHLISSGFDNTLKMWTIEEDNPEIVLRGHTDFISCLAISNDMKYIVTGSGSDDHTIRVWNLEGNLETVIEYHTEQINCLAISNDCKYLASCSDDSTITIRALNDLDKGRVLEGHDYRVTSIAFTPDGAYLISAGNDTKVIIWDLIQGKQMKALTGHTDLIRCLSVSEDGKLIATGSWDRTARIWSIQDERVKILDGHTSYIECLAFSRDGRYLITGSSDTTARIYDLQLDNTGKGRVLKGHTQAISCLAISNNGKTLVTGSRDSTAIIWSVSEASIEKVLTGHTDPIQCLAISTNSKFLVTAGNDNIAIIWNIETGDAEKILTGHEFPINCLALSHDGRFLVTGCSDFRARIWDVSNYFAEYSDTSSDVEVIRYENEMIKQRFINTALGRCADKYRSELNSVLVMPNNINILHMLAYDNKADQILDALAAGCSIVKSSNSESPVTIALRRNSRACLDALIDGITKMEDLIKIKSTMEAICEDITSILETGSKNLVPFLEFLFNKLDPVFIVPKGNLPIRVFSDFYSPTIENFKDQIDQRVNKAIQLVEIAHTRLKWNFQRGSSKSIELLDSIYNSPSQEIYRTDLVRSIIDLKWSQQYPINLTLSILYMINLLFFTFIIFHQDVHIPLEVSSYVFAILSLLFLFYEIYQAIVFRSLYFYEIWNYIDILRCPLCISTGILGILGVTPNTYQTLTIITGILCWVRGITYFRTFKYTRIFVSMILNALRDTSSFLIILLYTTIAYSTLFKISEGEKTSTLAESMTLAYELNLSAFETDDYSTWQWIIFMLASIVNCVIMLNLLISILGDSYERVQLNLVESDYSQMLEVILELEKMMIWNRNKGIQTYLHKCNLLKSEDSQEEWEGRIRALQDRISGVSTLMENRFNQIQSDQKELNQSQKNIENKLKETLQDIHKNLQESRQETQKTLESKLYTIEQAQIGVDSRLKEMYEMLQSLTRNSQA
jgi:WD40 repeat protein